MHACVCACYLYACVCVLAEDSRVIGAVVALKETPYIPPLSEVCPIGDTSSPPFRGLIGRTTGRAVLQKKDLS